MKFRKYIAILLLLALSLTLAACNTGDQSGETELPTGEELTNEPTEKATKKPHSEKVTEAPQKLDNVDGLDLNIKVLSQNVRCADDEGGNTVAQRTTRLKALIDEYKPDLIGTQETTFEWYKYLRSLEGYAIVGSSRNGHKKTSGEWSAILYNTERFVLMDSDTFWLTSTPDEVGSVENSLCRRICTWAELFDRYTGETIVMVNTHLDHSNDHVRAAQAGYLVYHLKARLGDRFKNCSLYLTGDFNCRKGSSPYSSIVENGDFVDARTVAAADNSVVNGTFHDYGTADMEIDFCFYRGDETVLEYEIISQKYVSEGETEAGFVSDHYGVIVTFKKEG